MTDAELRAVVAAVEALVGEDKEALAAMGAYENGADPYLWTRDYGRWGQVHLQVPPGDPREWGIEFTRTEDGWCAVDIDMWTAEEGRSDLTLQLELMPADDGSVQTRLADLHVL
jgi:hypothetical protein